MIPPRYGMVADTRKCVGCQACVIACKDENRLQEDGFRCWVVSETRGRFPKLTQTIRSERCNHCANASCVAACPTGASHYGPGGAVQVNPAKCTGCKACMVGCAYGARYVHDSGHIDKCSFCVHRVQRGELPACVSICPTNSLHFGDLNDPKSEVSRLLSSRAHRVLQPEQGTACNVFFLE